MIHTCLHAVNVLVAPFVCSYTQLRFLCFPLPALHLGMINTQPRGGQLSIYGQRLLSL